MKYFLTLPVIFASVASAELPPTVYKDLQAKAPEVLRIQVEAVDSKPKGFFDRSEWTETVTASVTGVVRSKSGVKTGDTITIVYSRLAPKGGWVGPTPPPQLAPGKSHTAFLAKSDAGTFSLAARGMSFSPLNPDS